MLVNPPNKSIPTPNPLQKDRTVTPKISHKLANSNKVEQKGFVIPQNPTEALKHLHGEIVELPHQSLILYSQPENVLKRKEAEKNTFEKIKLESAN
jgi:hypothetical protein